LNAGPRSNIKEQKLGEARGMFDFGNGKL
jgi:hypothetical protein